MDLITWIKKEISYGYEIPKDKILELIKTIDEKENQCLDLQSDNEKMYKTGFEDGKEEAINNMRNKLAEINS